MLCSENEVVISDNERSVATGSKCGFLYALNTVTPERALYTTHKGWRACLGPSSPIGILQMFSNNVAETLQINSKFVLNVCEVFPLPSETRPEIPKSSDFRVAKILELVHSEVCGPI